MNLSKMYNLKGCDRERLNSKLRTEGKTLETVLHEKNNGWGEKCRGKSFLSMARSTKICFLFRRVM